MKTTLGLVHYGTAAFLPLLIEWVKVYKASGCELPVVVFADKKVPIPEEFEKYTGEAQRFSYIRFDTTLNPGIMRPGKAFDAKGNIITQAIQQVLGPLLLVDTDAFFVKDPTPLIETLPARARIAMGEDPMTRWIQGVQDGRNAIPERNAGVLFFGESNQYDRHQLATRYTFLFRHLRELNNNPMLEQCTWTMLTLECGNLKLPKALNWSYLWGRSDEETYILHEHGPQKWNHLEGASRNKAGTLNPLYKDAYK
jgi:hypothetical protein